MNNLLQFKFYESTWMRCFDEFTAWYDYERKFYGKHFEEFYPTFEDALKAFYEELNREIV